MVVAKAVIPVAGLGTRFLPATLSVPKVMIPILNYPPLHYCIEEVIDSGITNIILVISENQREAIESYFDHHNPVISALTNKGNVDSLEKVEKIKRMVQIEYIVQERPLGLGHAILLTKESIGDNSFAVLLPDDLILGNDPTTKRMLDIHSTGSEVIIAIKKVAPEAIPNLGIIDTPDPQGQIRQITGMIEKPELSDAPSDLAIIGRYILPSEIFEAIENAGQGALGEIQLTDAIESIIPTTGCKGFLFEETHFDVGIPMGILKASIHKALSDEDTEKELKNWLANL
ncbi:MAG: UTP--glucose-1-phosphate uridylyltransferase [Dehalococcoidia bacterium]|tara:strand:- start:1817 stop:2677 length:861 start_codon:yes stop_codon:yes gene_type:complete